MGEFELISKGGQGADTHLREITVIKKAPTQKTINGILFGAAVIIFIAVIASYFVELNIFTDISIKELSTGAAWVFIGCFSISVITKQISINRARQTDEYKTQCKKTQDTLDDYARKGLLVYAYEYCKDYELKSLYYNRYKYLYPVGISVETFVEKYLAKSIFELWKNEKDLSFKQIIAISKANSVKIKPYNPDFLRSTVNTYSTTSPSGRFNTNRKNIGYTIRTLLAGLGGSLFVVAITKDLFVAFSTAALIEAVIKTTIIIISAAFSSAFGWNLIMETDMNRLRLQETEAKACADYATAKLKEVKENEV